MTKLNKQGVRDLNHIGKPKFPPGSGGNERGIDGAFPPLATAEYGEALDPQAQEFMFLLAEECGETVQRVTKILRFGLRRNPWDGKDNVDRFESEIGDILAALDVLTILGVIKPERIGAYEKKKLLAFVHEENPQRPRIRHMNAKLREQILRYVKDLEAL